MNRISALWHASPLKLVGALFALSLAAMMGVASGADFTSQTANAGNVVAAGNLTHGTPSTVHFSPSPSSSPATLTPGR